ncbi:SRPBCC family protein [Actinomadura rubrisoli]|uniref:SRPBCC family protein n=1 Tax=Actinomadura rubrisoli TaxID=2530368 RepID=A0A4R5B8S5_9ACTN|nr:SRPBCC family protein [Actinomadura rubrisoli]TDD80926.1 SRPBCC family protein [Actinomadura rubrisoli]
MPYTYAVTSHSQASPEAVFTALVHPATWPSWSPIDSVELEDGADPEKRQQVGDIRIFRAGRGVARERIVELVTDRRFVYENTGSPFRSYRGTVELAESPHGGTDITWTGTFRPRLPLTGPFWQWYLTRFMQRMADGLAAYAAAPDPI